MAAPRIHIDYHTGQAVYRQIAEQVKFQIAAGELAPGAQLPSIRTLAGDLKINSRTVVKAYEHLATEHLVVLRHGQGVFVAQNRGGVPAAARRKSLDERAGRMLADAASMGASLAEVLDSINRVARSMGMIHEQ